jgi:hypothetical protein
MKLEYQVWINNWIENNNPYLKCREATDLMKGTFSELRRIRGHVLTEHGERSHWWLVDEENNIIDPTKSQFKLVAGYVPWDGSQPEPTGKCPNCGGLCYNYHTLCSDKCEIEYKAYVSKPW